MAELKTQGIILGSRIFGEADQLVTLYGRHRGKLRAVAKNAKKSKKRFMNCLDDYGLVQVSLVRKAGRDLDRLDSCRLVARPNVGTGPFLLGLAGLAAEAVDVYCPEDQEDKDLFLALKTVLFGLPETTRPRGLVLAFLLRLLHAAGFGPNLETCLHCGRELEEMTGATFDHQTGGLACRPCLGHGDHVSLGGLKTIRLCQQIDPAGLTRLRFPAGDEGLIFDLTASYLAHTAGREIRSLSFLEKLAGRG